MSEREEREMSPTPGKPVEPTGQRSQKATKPRKVARRRPGRKG